MLRPYVLPLFCREASWLDDTSFPCSLTSCHSNYLETRLSLGVPGELHQCHSRVHTPQPTHDDVLQGVSGKKAHAHTCTRRQRLQSDIHTHTQTHEDQRRSHKHTHTIQSTQWQADRQTGSGCDRCSFAFNPH